MSTNDTPRIEPGDLAEALALLTRLPVSRDGRRGILAAWAWPLAGVVVALFAGLIALIALKSGLSPALSAGIALCTTIILTGALHEDGLADCADGFWGGWDRDARLLIMRDSAVGTYGALALIASLGLRWGALSLLLEQGQVFAPLIAVAALSRVPMVAILHYMPAARSDGLAKDVGLPAQNTLILAATTAALIALIFIGFSAIGAAIAAALAGLSVASIAKAKIGGHTGDVLGASQQLSEIAALLVLSALAT